MEKSAIQQMVLEKLGIWVPKNEIGFINLILYKKSIQKQIKDLKLKPEMLKQLEENLGTLS